MSCFSFYRCKWWLLKRIRYEFCGVISITIAISTPGNRGVITANNHAVNNSKSTSYFNAYKLVLLIIMQSTLINHVTLFYAPSLYICSFLSSPLKLIFFLSQTTLPTMSDSCSSCSYDSEELDLANIIEEYIAQQNVLGSIATQSRCSQGSICVLQQLKMYNVGQ